MHIFTVLHFTFFPDSTLAKLYSALDCPVLRFTFQILPRRENFTVHWMFSRQSTHCKSFKGKTNCEEFGNYKHHYKRQQNMAMTMMAIMLTRDKSHGNLARCPGLDFSNVLNFILALAFPPVLRSVKVRGHVMVWG